MEHRAIPLSPSFERNLWWIALEVPLGITLTLSTYYTILRHVMSIVHEKFFHYF